MFARLSLLLALKHYGEICQIPMFRRKGPLLAIGIHVHTYVLYHGWKWEGSQEVLTKAAAPWFQPFEPLEVSRYVSQSRWSHLSLEAGARGVVRVVRVVRVVALSSYKSKAAVLLTLGPYVVNLCEYRTCITQDRHEKT